MAQATIYEDTNPRALGELLSEVHAGASVLPDFQRSFVWDPALTGGLLESLFDGYPAGSILRVRNTKDYFQWRCFEGVASPTAVKPTFLVLDGQQRLTSLYQAIYGKGPQRFFLRLAPLLDKSPDDEWDYEAAIDWETAGGKGEAQLLKPEVQQNELVLPLDALRPDGDVTEWINSTAVQRLTSQGVTDVGRVLTEQARLKAAIDPVRTAITNYRFPVVTLSDDTSDVAICTIFETLNRTGVKLTPFELLTARYFPRGVRLRNLWDKAKFDHPLLADYQIDPYAILQTISLRAKGSAKRSHLMALTAETVATQWEPVCRAMSDCLSILQADCGVASARWLPYMTMLAPMAAALSDRPVEKGLAAGGRKRKFIRWFWGASLGQAYGSATNSQAERDYPALVGWLDGGSAPLSAAANVRAEDLRLVAPQQRAIYNALMCLLISQGARDFHTISKIDGTIIEKESVEDHHIFPLDSLGVKDRRTVPIEYDNILNRTLIDLPTNRSIGGDAPSRYLPRIDQAWAEEGRETPLNDILATHLISPAAVAAMRDATGDISETFEAFKSERQKSFEAAIDKIMWPLETAVAPAAAS